MAAKRPSTSAKSATSKVAGTMKKGAKKGAKKAAKNAKGKPATVSDEYVGHVAGPLLEPPVWRGGKKCSKKKMCKYLADLGLWLAWFNDDYKKLRIAVCNVERKAWQESGVDIHRRFCTGGTTDEPMDPVKPPIWS